MHVGSNSMGCALETPCTGDSGLTTSDAGVPTHRRQPPYSCTTLKLTLRRNLWQTGYPSLNNTYCKITRGSHRAGDTGGSSPQAAGQASCSTTLAKDMKRQSEACQDAPRQWVGPPTAHTFLDIMYHWKQYRHTRSAELLMHTIQHQTTEAHLQARDEAALQYRQWLVQGEARGLQGLFRCLKASELAWQHRNRQRKNATKDAGLGQIVANPRHQRSSALAIKWVRGSGTRSPGDEIILATGDEK